MKVVPYQIILLSFTLFASFSLRCVWKWIAVFLDTQLVHHLVMHLLLSDIFLHSCCIQSYCRHIQSFRYPMNELTLSFKGISRRRCTWSGIRCPSTISTPLYLQSSFMISFRSFRYWPYISFRLYFGVNTIWYVQYHFVCDSELALWAIRHHLSFLFGGNLNTYHHRRNGDVFV